MKLSSFCQVRGSPLIIYLNDAFLYNCLFSLSTSKLPAMLQLGACKPCLLIIIISNYHSFFIFFTGCEIDGGESGVHFTFSREGRPSGEAFVELASEEDVANATAQNNEHIGSRYIEGTFI